MGIRVKHSLAFAALLIFATEVGLRLTLAGPVEYLRQSEDRGLVWELVPGVHESNGTLLRIPDFTVSVEDNGCRAAPPTQRGSGLGEPQQSILFLGDSFAFGQGVDDGDVFSSVLAEELGGSGATLHNCAVDGYNLGQITRAAQLRADEIKPRLTVILFFSNDLEERLTLERMMPKGALPRGLTRHSRIARLVSLLAAVPPFGVPTRLTPRVVGEHLSSIQQSVRDAGSRLVFVSLDGLSHPTFSLKEDAGRRRIPWLEPPFLLGRDTTIPGNGHLNPEGHRQLALWLAQALREHLVHEQLLGVGPLQGD